MHLLKITLLIILRKAVMATKTLKLCITLLEESHDTCRTLFATTPHSTIGLSGRFDQPRPGVRGFGNADGGRGV